MVSSVAEHFAQLCIMAVLILSSHAFTRRVHRQRLRTEAANLQIALKMSLRAVHKLYAGNIRLLTGGKAPLISARSQIMLLRIQLGRLISLDQAKIEAVLAANFAAEEAETAMAVVGKGVGGVAFTIPEGNECKATLHAAFLEACARLESAEALMYPAEMARTDRSADHNSAASRRSSRLQIPRPVLIEHRAISENNTGLCGVALH